MEPADYDWLTDARYEVPRRRRRSPRRSSRTLFGEYVSLPDSPTRQSGLPFTTFGGMGRHMGLGGQESRQPGAGRQASAAHAFSSWLSHRARAFYFLAERPQLDADMHFKHAFPVLPTNYPTNRKKRSKGAWWLALMWRALKVHAAAEAASWADPADSADARLGR